MKTKGITTIMITLFLAILAFNITPVKADVLSGNTLFSDDFERNWNELSGTWSIIQDIAPNHVYWGRGTVGKRDISVAPPSLMDLTIEVKVKNLAFGTYAQGGLIIFRWNGLLGDPVEREAIVCFFADHITLQVLDSAGWHVLGSYAATIDYTWHDLKITASDTHYEVFLDGSVTPVISADFTPDSPLGDKLGVWAYEGGSAYFDDFVVKDALGTEVFSDDFELKWTEVNGIWTVENDGTGNHIYVQSQPYYIPGVRSVAGESSWTDYAVQAKVKVTGTTWGRWGGILFRVTAPGTAGTAGTYYELYLQEGGRLQLVRTVAGARVGIMNPFVGLFYNDWWYIKAEVSGGSIKGKAWKVGDPEPPTWLIEYTDPTPIASGKIGLITFSNVAGQPVYFDDVVVTGLGTWFMDFDWLPPVDGTKTFYKDGSTIPIKFTIHNTVTGDFVVVDDAELKVTIQKFDGTWTDVTDAWATSAHPLYDHTTGADEYLRTDMYGEYYIVNWHTDGAALGDYRFVVTLDSAILGTSLPITLVPPK